MSISTTAFFVALLAVLVATGDVNAEVELYQQCGGDGFTGTATCVDGSSCQRINAHFWQCRPIQLASTTALPSEYDSSSYPEPTGSPTTCITWWSLPSETGSSSTSLSTPTQTVVPSSSSSSSYSSSTTSVSSEFDSDSSAYPDPTGSPTTCLSGWDTSIGSSSSSSSYSESTTDAPSSSESSLWYTWSTTTYILPSPSSSVVRRAPEPQITTITTITVTEPLPTTTTRVTTELPVSFPPPRTCSIGPPPANPTPLNYKGANIAGFNLGIDANGVHVLSAVKPPLTELGGPDGAGQMKHFVQDDAFNIFRLPVTWQYLTGGSGVAIDEAAFGKYDQLVKKCLAAGASCIVDLHNFGRLEGKIIGQGGPTHAVFGAVWADIASRYANESKVIFGLMNEPHDIPNVVSFYRTIQAAVTAIRGTPGAFYHTILIPSIDWSSPYTFPSNATGGGPTLNHVRNPDGSARGLVFDVHAFTKGEFNATKVGGTGDCPSTTASAAFIGLRNWLKCEGRQALVTAVGGLPTKSCEEWVCKVTAYLKANSDAFIGYVGWSAGSYDAGYPLSQTPTYNARLGVWADTSLVKACLV